MNLPVQEFLKSVNIWRRYGQKFGVLFFWLTVYMYTVIHNYGNPYEKWNIFVDWP